MNRAFVSIASVLLVVLAAPLAAAAGLDTDGDGTPDDADADDDNDGINDVGTIGQPLDNCRTTRNSNQNDADADAVGDACDADIDGDGIANGSDADMDGDGATNAAEQSAGTDPANARSSPGTPANEAAPGCESTQPWIGYGRTQELRALYASADPARRVNTCEGEHWDGQDTTQPTGTPPPGGPACPLVATPEGGVTAANCMQANPNFGESTLLGFRVSTSGAESFYVAITLGPVGRGAVSHTRDADSTTTGVYVRDNTEGDLLASAVSSLRITRGFVRNGDCTQAQYEAGAYGESPVCGRDNTAITIETLLA